MFLYECRQIYVGMRKGRKGYIHLHKAEVRKTCRAWFDSEYVCIVNVAMCLCCLYQGDFFFFCRIGTQEKISLLIVLILRAVREKETNVTWPGE